jgi:hypothetical protein
MIIEYNEYVRAITRELSGEPRKVAVASFNVHAGISARGGIYQTDSYKLLQIVNELEVDSRVLVGVGPTCGEDLPKRLTNCAEHFRSIEWRTRPNCHLKCWIFHRRSGEVKALVGGRNLGDSEWADVSVWLPHKDAAWLLRFYDTLWASAWRVKTSNLKIKVGGRKV